TFCDGGPHWNKTKAGRTAKLPCPSGRVGNKWRRCSFYGKWGNVTENCTSAILNDLFKNIMVFTSFYLYYEKKLLFNLSDPIQMEAKTASDLELSMKILGIMANISFHQNATINAIVFSNILAVASNITNRSLLPSYSTSNEEKSTFSTLLQAVETFSLLLQPDNETFEVFYPNVQMKGMKFSVRSRRNNEQKIDMTPYLAVCIDMSNIFKFPENVNVIIITVTYASLPEVSPIFPDKFQDYFVNSLIHSTSVRVNNMEYKEVNIQMVFELRNTSVNLESAACVYWDFSLRRGRGGWAEDGCNAKTDGNITTCHCSHLTSFAVLMSRSPPQEPEYIYLVTYLGLGVSIGSLCICIFIEVLVWKSVVKSNLSHFRHVALLNIAVSLLIADICFVCASSNFVLKVAHACTALTFLNHFFYMALFFWSLCQSIILLHKMVFPFSLLRKKTYLRVSFLIGYFFPLGIAAATLLYFYPKGKYQNKIACWLDQSGAMYAFVVPVGCIIVTNLITLIVVIAKLMRPSISDGGHVEEKDVAKRMVKALLILIPTFGVTWALGYLLIGRFPQEVLVIFK
uniref:Uncharacterized protein n=1 Tax=Latimeria chalumnae TaxID=7897 RepID=H2ZVI1_LATCH